MAPPAGLEPATYGLTVHRYGDFQSPALPTELSRHLVVYGVHYAVFFRPRQTFFYKKLKIPFIRSFFVLIVFFNIKLSN